MPLAFSSLVVAGEHLLMTHLSTYYKIFARFLYFSWESNFFFQKKATTMPMEIISENSSTKGKHCPTGKLSCFSLVLFLWFLVLVIKLIHTGGRFDSVEEHLLSICEALSSEPKKQKYIKPKDWWLKKEMAPAENPGSVPKTNQAAWIYLWLQFHGIWWSVVFLSTNPLYMCYTHKLT